MSAATINAELQAALVALLAAADEVFGATTDGAEQVAIAGLAMPRYNARDALRNAARTKALTPEQIDVLGMRVLREGSYPTIVSTVPYGTELQPLLRAFAGALAGAST